MDSPDFQRKNLEQQVFSAQHRDYRTVMADGRKACFIPGRGTELIPLETLSRAELIAALKALR